MRYLLLLCAFTATSSCLAQNKASDVTATISEFEWLVGTWDRTNSKPGRTGHERWLMDSDKQLKGFGVSLRDQDTTFVEKLKIIITDTAVYYVGDVPENKEPVYFKLTKHAKNQYVFENPAHDFPNKIVYNHDGDNLHATVSGNGKAIDYYFIKRKK